VSPLEAMENGCAVICADDNGSAPYIENGYDGLVFNSNSYEDFSICMHSLIKNYQEIFRIGRNAMKTIKKRHSCKSFVSVFFNLIGVTVK
jgi:glycosyltransferase involved in cell wall biosynthesis